MPVVEAPNGPVRHVLVIFSPSVEASPPHTSAEEDQPASRVPSSDPCRQPLTIRPRRKASGDSDAAPAEPVVISQELLESVRGLPLRRAAAAVGVSPTAFKKACRKLGLPRWPSQRRPAVRCGAGCASSPPRTPPKRCRQQQRPGAARLDSDLSVVDSDPQPATSGPMAAHREGGRRGRAAAAMSAPAAAYSAVPVPPSARPRRSRPRPAALPPPPQSPPSVPCRPDGVEERQCQSAWLGATPGPPPPSSAARCLGRPAAPSPGYGWPGAVAGAVDDASGCRRRLEDALAGPGWPEAVAGAVPAVDERAVAEMFDAPWEVPGDLDGGRR